jgi:hypothetical protein
VQARAGRSGAGFFLPSKFGLDTNQRKIHYPRLRGAVAASRLTNTENAKPRNSKARQGRAVRSGTKPGNSVI